MKIVITDIVYCIEPEDVQDEFDEDSYALRSDFINDCENKIDEIIEELPSTIIINTNETFENSDDLSDFLCDEITNKTGWLVNRFEYHIFKE